jgi:surface polysaccharide O-acyltransferase-like enzyme
MPSKKIMAIEYIRGISMLGVIGIHTGAYSLSNPKVNIYLFALLEIVTRFSVPIFFFASAFGLFITQDLTSKFNYRGFLGRRLRTVLVPYIVWSVIYMIHYTLVSGDAMIWHPPLLYEYALFGLASYQLYFLVILLWFYALMPFWRFWVSHIINHPVRNLGIILLLQILFNYYSSYMLHADFSNHYVNKLIFHRLSYWIFHYLFIFLLGAVCAVKYARFKEMINNHQTFITTFFYLTLIGILSYYYYLLSALHYTPEAAVNTAHQLSPIGVFYTLSSTLFLFMVFSNETLPQGIKTILSKFGEHSYPVYLVHPLVMYYLSNYIAGQNLLMTALVTIAFYMATIGISLVFSLIIKKIGYFLPIISILLTGSKLSKSKSGV